MNKKTTLRRFEATRFTIMTHADKLYRQYALGGMPMVREAETCEIITRTWTEWKRYSRRHNYPRTAGQHTVHVTKRWALDVAARGLAVLDGMLTLNARLDHKTATYDVYRAVWASQGVGNSINNHWGWIAVSLGVSYHSEISAQHAVAGLVRKIKNANKPAAQKRSPVERAAAVWQRIATDERLQNVRISLEDSLAVGNCESGSLSAIASLNLDTQAAKQGGNITLREFHAAVAAYAAHIPSDILKAGALAVLHAVRKARRQQRYVAA